MTLATFQTTGLGAKLQGATAIDASDASSAQIDAFIANHTGANAGSLQGSSVDAAQFVALKQAGLLATASATVDGVVALDATDATAAQMAQIAAGAALINDEAISNAYVLSSDFATLDSLLALDGSNTLDASATAAAGSAALLALVTTYADALDAVVNLSVDGAGILALDATNSALINKEIILASTTTSAQMDAVIEYRACFEVGSITSSTSMTLAQVLEIPNKFAAGAVGAMSLASATTAQLTALAANASIVANGVLTAATVTPAQFSSLASKIATSQATVDAATATKAEVDTIIGNLTKFVATTGLTNLEVTANQWASIVTAANVANLATATTNGEVTIVCEEAATVDASTYTKTLNIVGSSGSDYVVGAGAAANTIQGAQGSDYIKGSSAADELRGGNAKDTIIGGAGADTIYGGKSAASQTLTGDLAGIVTSGIDTFNLSASSINNITDLAFAGSGDGGVGAQDIIVNAAGAVTTATVITDWTAQITSSNAGTLTLTADDATGVDIDTSLMLGGVGVTLNGGALANALTGTNWADSISGLAGNDTLDGGAAGNDTLAGGAGTNTLTGGNGYDTYVVTNTGADYDTITDLATGDIITVAADGEVRATVSEFVATAATTNAGVGTITGTAAADYLSFNLAAGTNGWSVSGLADADTIIGSAQNDTITGGAAADNLSGGAGTDSFVATVADFAASEVVNGGTGTDTMTVTFGADTALTYVGRTVSGLEGLTFADIASGDTVVVTQGTGLTTVTGFTDASTATLTLNAGSTSFDAAAVASAALVTAAGNWYFVDAGSNDQLTYWDQTTAAAVTVTLVGTDTTIAVTGGNLVLTA